MLRILLVDDHAVVRIGLARILQEAFPGVTIGEADDGPPAVELAVAYLWDVIVLDITLPTFSGIETLVRMMRLQVKAKVLMLSMHAGRQYVLGSLRAGAAGYLSKESAPDELADAVRQVLAGGTYLSQSLSVALASVDTFSRS